MFFVIFFLAIESDNKVQLLMKKEGVQKRNKRKGIKMGRETKIKM